jgi:hypothetical protein
MRGYVARKGDRWYAVVYEGRPGDRQSRNVEQLNSPPSPGALVYIERPHGYLGDISSLRCSLPLRYSATSSGFTETDDPAAR